MWGFGSSVFATAGLRKNSPESVPTLPESSDDEVCSNASREERLECPICSESFNIVENVPFVLWCGHTLCGNCVLGLQCTVLQHIKIPFFISCPWCQLLSLRLVCNGSLRFPRKNFFLLWMVERLNGDRVKSSSSTSGVDQPVWSSKGNMITENQVRNRRSSSSTELVGQLGSQGGDDHLSNATRQHSPFHKSLDFFVHITSKFSLVVIFVLIIFFAAPICATILLIYLLLTVLFAIPSFLVLYFAYPTLVRLVQEIIL